MEHRTARRALIVALLGGLVAEVVFDRQPLGIGVPLFVVATLVLVTVFSAEWRPADRLDWWLPATAVAASLGPALRTDSTVVFLDLVMVVLAVAAWSVAVSGVAVTRRAADAVVALALAAGAAMATAPAWLIRILVGQEALTSAVRAAGRLAPVVRGLLIAVPIVAGFAFLLGSADAVFGHALDDALSFSFDIDDVAGRTAFTLIVAALVAGPVAVAAGFAGSAGFPVGPLATVGGLGPSLGLPPASAAATGAQQPSTARAGLTEAIVVLVAVDVLFAAFAAVQVVFLFGGRDTLAAIGMTYSDYARQGYFQLVGVVALAGLLVIGAHHAVGRTRAFVAAALVLLVLTALILVSAAVWMALYQGAYGWTELRFFVVASIAWLGICVVAAVTLLAWGRMRWLPHTLAMGAVAVTLVVSAIGPQAFVMQENVARVLDPGRVAPGGFAGVDLEYGMTLGDDAIPALVQAVQLVPSGAGSTLQRQLELRYGELRAEAHTSGPLSWNLARQDAIDALHSLLDPYGPSD